MQAPDLSRIEPEARERLEDRISRGYNSEAEGQSAMTLSIAISLKRIADAFDTLNMYTEMMKDARQ